LLTVRDNRWSGQPLDWALVGSGETPALTSTPDWPATVTLLLDAGAPTGELTVGDGDPKQPSTAVIELLRSRRLTGNP
jgi:hypothetical protein